MSRRREEEEEEEDMDALCGFLLSPLPCVRIGSFARLLPSFEVVAVSQSSSSESNSDSLTHFTDRKVIF